MAQTEAGRIKVCAKKIGVSVRCYLARIQRGLKWCTKGRHWQPISGFDVDQSRYDCLSASCIPCRRVKVRICTKGRVSSFKGHQHTPEAKAKMSAARIGKPAPWKRGPMPAETRKKISAIVKERAPRGENHYAWKNGQRQRNLVERRSAEAEQWRRDVYRRDNYTCQDCGHKKGRNLQAHHIKSWAEFPELRFVLSNGVTLCRLCHRARH